MMKWKLVPVEATELQKRIMYSCHRNAHWPESLYKKSVAAAPDPTLDEALIQLVAEVGCDALHGYNAWECLNDSERQDHLDAARAVLAALKGGV